MGVPVGVNPITPNSIFQVVAEPNSVQDKSAEPAEILEADKFEGAKQEGDSITVISSIPLLLVPYPFIDSPLKRITTFVELYADKSMTFSVQVSVIVLSCV